MNQEKNDTTGATALTDTIVAVATPPGEGGIGIGFPGPGLSDMGGYSFLS
jgi:hypothetical protein